MKVNTQPSGSSCGFALVTLTYVSIAAGLSKWLAIEKNYQLINRLLAGVFLLLALVIIIR
jgi:threonine/homoserine/homoserine lactone efflux protein